MKICVDTDRNMVRMRASGAKSQTSRTKTVTRNVSRDDLKRIVGTGARLSSQFERIMTAMMRDQTGPNRL